jgi:hypothetical protein
VIKGSRLFGFGLSGMTLWLGSQAVGQDTPTKDLSCIENLKIPIYQHLARDARASGTVRALVEISPKGSAASVKVEGTGARILKAGVEATIESARFGISCTGQTLEINFIYRLEGKPSAEPINQIYFNAPNTFEVVSTPAIPRPTEPSITGN